MLSYTVTATHLEALSFWLTDLKEPLPLSEEAVYWDVDL